MYEQTIPQEELKKYLDGRISERWREVHNIVDDIKFFKSFIERTAQSELFKSLPVAIVPAYDELYLKKYIVQNIMVFFNSDSEDSYYDLLTRNDMIKFMTKFLNDNPRTHGDKKDKEFVADFTKEMIHEVSEKCINKPWWSEKPRLIDFVSVGSSIGTENIHEVIDIAFGLEIKTKKE